MKERTARCCCGDLSITFRGEPERVLRCHCRYCQRRTGNVFQTSAWFFEDQIVARTGTGRVFTDSENNAGVEYTFCPRCGSTVFWPFSMLSGVYGVAVGCFNDPNFPRPSVDLQVRHQHDWIEPLDDAETYDEFPPPEWMEPKRL
jgi:hypothetical protein